MSYITDIKENLYCGDCRFAKMQIWDSASQFDKLENRGYLVEHSDTESHFLVRCMFFKENVLQPHKMKKCECKQGFDAE